MTPEEVIDKAQSLGAVLAAKGDRLRVDAPRGALSLELRQALAEHKAQILEHLNQQEHVNGRYQKVYSSDGPGEDELAEIERRVNEAGYVLCWSEALEDFIAFHREDVDPTTIPPGFVAYSLTELTHLFREDGQPLSVNALRLVLQAKKYGARVTGNYPNGTQEPRR